MTMTRDNLTTSNDFCLACLEQMNSYKDPYYFAQTDFYHHAIMNTPRGRHEDFRAVHGAQESQLVICTKRPFMPPFAQYTGHDYLYRIDVQCKNSHRLASEHYTTKTKTKTKITLQGFNMIGIAQTSSLLLIGW